MQSGISVSQELHDAFGRFSSDPSSFCLPVTITAERLTPLDPIPFSGSSSSPESFFSSLAQVSSVLQPKTPIYLLLRRPTSASSALVALTYIPSNAPVRPKMLFASTRSTLTRELGTEKFTSTVFATEEEEILGRDAWRERDGEIAGGVRREDLMGEKERELEAVRKAEAEARSGTPHRDIGIGGTFGPGSGSGMRVSMPVDEAAKTALRALQQGSLVQLVCDHSVIPTIPPLGHYSTGIVWSWYVFLDFGADILDPMQTVDIHTETITLADNQPDVEASSVASHISSSSPRYSFYHYPGSDVVVFVYTCPTGSSIKERMLHASSRRSAIAVAEGEGLKIEKKIEASSPDEITAHRLQEEVSPPQNQGTARGFARPRRPGR
ncbi:Actin-binding cofilin/tropomyosin type [Penicillium hispanicum]|uniref:Actin-binding cofilin/tropomyosin type n=1 Tax=Penicillium hispanicum TaxID=1080232 RepID=UPI002540A944|nr:Actin-binding cofilin/tropomyosin type [Penicillium hispanicum]KAJ5584979.1 Actin-binding cofilin/tropomyosin type [Penicillium hispanicum]